MEWRLGTCYALFAETLCILSMSQLANCIYSRCSMLYILVSEAKDSSDCILVSQQMSPL